MDVGLNRLTALWDARHKHVGWEASCNHPLHNHGGTRCRLNRRFGKGADAATLLRKFKVWFALGLQSNCHTHKDHADKWPYVEELQLHGDIPDAVPPVEAWDELRNGFGLLSSSASSSSA